VVARLHRTFFAEWGFSDHQLHQKRSFLRQVRKAVSSIHKMPRRGFLRRLRPASAADRME